MAINVRPENEEQQAPRPVGVFDQAFLTGVPDVTEVLLSATASKRSTSTPRLLATGSTRR